MAHSVRHKTRLTEAELAHIPAMVELYRNGLSSREVANQFGIDHGTVLKYVRAAGSTRSLIEASRLRYAEHVNQDIGHARRKSRKVWERAVGMIPNGFVIHHKDGNPLNLSLDNLACLWWSDHVRLHWMERRTNVA